MDNDLRKYYEERFSMFASQGWKDLIEDIDVRIQTIISIKNVANIEQLRLRQGELETLEWIKGLPALTNKVFEQLKDDYHATI